MTFQLFLIQLPRALCGFFFFFNDTATTEIYTLSLHDALPICAAGQKISGGAQRALGLSSVRIEPHLISAESDPRSEEHTSELQSRLHLVCRLLLEKKKEKLRYTSSRVARRATVRHSQSFPQPG